MTELEEFDSLKTKVLKYVLYKKRSEYEIRQKFSENSGNILENVIEYLKENNYINDKNYVERAVTEYINLKNLSINELKYKLLSKGINKNIIEDYIYVNWDKLVEYELKSAKNIFIKKERTLEKDQIIIFLRKKGYLSKTINYFITDELN